MAKVSIYLNFKRETESAFTFYQSVFGTQLSEIHRMGSVPAQPGQPLLSEEDKNLVMHVSLPIFDGYELMGTDAPESMGFKLTEGNNIYINLEPDTRTQTQDLFNKLSQDGKIAMPLQEMFWGDYFGSLTDKFGINWMFNCSSKV